MIPGGYHVRSLESADVAEVWETFSDQTGFRTSQTIRFYDEAELEYWAHDKQSLFLILEHSTSVFGESLKVIVGFAFVKYISPSWAMLDGFYILPAHRGDATCRLLLTNVERAVEQHGTEYISTLVSGESLDPLLKRKGFEKGYEYTWMEKWTKAPRTSVGRLGFDRISK